MRVLESPADCVREAAADALRQIDPNAKWNLAAPEGGQPREK